MSPNRWELKSESLRAVCDPDALGFETTSDVSPLKEKVVAQDRAVHALEFGLGVKDLEYNIFVAGPPRAGKTETIMAYVQELAATEPTPPLAPVTTTAPLPGVTCASSSASTQSIAV